MLRINVVLNALFLLISSQTFAQQLLELPLPQIQDKVIEHNADQFIEINNSIFFPALTAEHGYVVLKLDPLSNITTLEARLPFNLLNPVRLEDTLKYGMPRFQKIGQRVLIGNSYWYDPATKLFSSAIDQVTIPSNEQQYCALNAWDDGLVMSCKAGNFKLNTQDGLFHPHNLVVEDQTLLDSSNSQIPNQREGQVFCYAKKGWDQACSEWPSGRTIEVPGAESDRTVSLSVLQTGILWWTQKNNVFFHSWDGNAAQKINKTPIADEFHIFSSSPRTALLFKGDNNTGYSYHRYFYATGEIENLSVMQHPGSFEDVFWQENDDFIAVDRARGIVKIAADKRFMEILRGADYYSSDFRGKLVPVSDGLVYGIPFCDSWDCQENENPAYAFYQNGQLKQFNFESVTAPENTPIHQLYSWQENLFWVEYNSPYLQIKKYDPSTQLVTSVYQYAGAERLTEHEKILSSDKHLLLIKNQEFLLFDTISNSFKPLSQNAAVLATQGLLSGDSYYYFVIHDAETMNASTELRRFDLSTGTIHSLKTYEKTVFSRLLALKNQQIYLSYANVAADAGSGSLSLTQQGGMLSLGDFLIKSNKALTGTGESLVNYQRRTHELTDIFEHHGQWFGVRSYAYGNWWTHSFYYSLIKLDLAAEAQIPLSDKLISFRAFENTERPFDKVAILGDNILTSWGEHFDKNGKEIYIPGIPSFHSSFFSGKSLYLIGSGLTRVNTIAGQLKASELPLELGTIMIRRSGAAKLGKELYFSAFDMVNGERVRLMTIENLAPIANQDTASVTGNAAMVIDVLLNDEDPDGDVLTVVKVNANSGTSSILADGKISYQANQGFSGVDKIEYLISDAEGKTATGEVIVTVHPVNQLPTVRDSSSSVGSGKTLVIDVSMHATDPDGDVLQVVAVKSQHGQTSIQSGMKFQYQSNSGFTGTDIVEYEVQDPKGGTAKGKVTVTVTATEVPQVTKPDTPAGKSGGSLAFSWLMLLWSAVQFRSRWNSKSQLC
jgi:hypothetical protein